MLLIVWDVNIINRTNRQKECIQNWLKSGARSTLVLPTGFGKTRIGLMIISSFVKRDPTFRVLIVVPTQVIKDQWLNLIIKNQLFTNCEVEIINTVIKKKWECDLMIQDECHAFAANTYKSVFESVSYTYLLCLTATIERLDGKHEIILQYAPIADKITVEEAVANNWLSDYREYKVLIDVDNIEEYNIINQNFINYFSYFNYDFNFAMKMAIDPKTRYSYCKKSGLNPKAVTAMAFDWSNCMRKRKAFVMSHPKKFEIANKIIEHRPNAKIITFSATIKDTELIKYGQTLHSGKTKKKNRITLEEFNEVKSGVLNSAKSLIEGVDVKGLNTAIIISGNSSSRQKVQSIGRVVRYEEGKIAEIFTLVIKGTVEESWYNNASTTNYITIDENELDIVLKTGSIELRTTENIKNINYRF